ncbi:MAG: ATP-binding cassette domain-containing protein [Acidimicrobiaceae bacterium]|nr:ATP-binding cassette domain-containing protein [Acidimicrobiaceae bacterium]
MTPSKPVGGAGQSATGSGRNTNGASGGVGLSVRHLVKIFEVGGGWLGGERGEVSAVAGVSFDIGTGKTLGLVGESGCGKSTTARCILRLIEPTSGDVVLQRRIDGGEAERIDVMAADKGELRRLRRDMQIVFQDPFASLNPRMSVGQALREPLVVHTSMSKNEQNTRVAGLLRLVGLDPRIVDRYPHEFSGGQRQRIGVARALAFDPGFLVLDEPVSALDVSVQAQVLNLLDDLQDELGLTYLFIAHDLAVVRHVCDDIAVMYLGKIVERTSTDRLFDESMHPYTHALLSAVPVPDPEQERGRLRILLEGDVPSPLNPPSGCRFHTRCHVGRDQEVCRVTEPPLEEVSGGHWVACHFPEKRRVV